MNNFKRLDGETDDQVIFRICSLKDQIGTWQDVANILNGITDHNYTESAFRKKYQYYNKMNIECSDKNSRDIEIERKKLQAEKVEYNKWLREDARDQVITEKIIDAIKGVKSFDVPKLIDAERDNGIYLLTFADAHYGIEFSIEDLFGEKINEYSPEIFESRMETLLNKTIEVVRKEGINTLNIWELGDGIQGMLRLNSQLMKLRYGVIESAINYAEYLATWLNTLSHYVRINFQMVTDSNHCQLRLVNAPKNAFPEENMSKVMMLVLKYRLENNPNIKIIENSTGMNYLLAYGHSILGIHGEVKNLGKALDDYSRFYGVPIDYIIGAHNHHYKSEELGDNVEAISIRSIIGVDDYARSIRKSSSPGASLFRFSSVEGLNCEYKFKL